MKNYRLKKEAKPPDKSDTRGQISRLMSRREVASMLGVHTETIKRYQRKGLLPAIVFNSRLIRYERTEVERLIQEGRVG